MGKIVSRAKNETQKKPIYSLHQVWIILFYSRTEKGKNYSTHYRKKEGSEKEEIILDENELAKGHDFFTLRAYDASYTLDHDHQLLVYSTDVTGQERYTLRIKDLKTGSLLDDQLDNICGKVIWHKNAMVSLSQS